MAKPLIRTAHPRARGKYDWQQFVQGLNPRSPPRTREIRLERRRLLFAVPLTPAHAGNTRSPRYLAMSCSAHPRARGKYT